LAATKLFLKMKNNLKFYKVIKKTMSDSEREITYVKSDGSAGMRVTECDEDCEKVECTKDCRIENSNIVPDDYIPIKPDSDSYDSEEDPWADARDTEKKVGSSTINLYTEMRYARALWKRACLGFESNPPPEPLTWLTNAHQLAVNWENYKVSQIGIIESGELSEKDCEMLKELLKTTTAIYFDLMCSIYNTFIKASPEDLDFVANNIPK